MMRFAWCLFAAPACGTIALVFSAISVTRGTAKPWNAWLTASCTSFSLFTLAWIAWQAHRQLAEWNRRERELIDSILHSANEWRSRPPLRVVEDEG